MSTRTYAYTIGAGATAVAPGGRFFYVKSASSAIDIRTRGTPSSPVDFIGVGAGLKFGPVDIDKMWRYLDITSAAAQVVELVISDDAEVDIASTVNVAGSVMTTEVAATVIATPARVTVNDAGIVLLCAQNLSRRLLTVQLPLAATSAIVVGPTAVLTATRGIEIAPGGSWPFAGSFALYGRSILGNQDVQVAEQT